MSTQRSEMGFSTNMRYVISALAVIPVLPAMYLQGVRIRKSVPRLPEAEGPQGSCGKDNGSKLRLLIIGESTMAGVGVNTHELGFAGRFAWDMANEFSRKVDWNVYAKSGYTANDLCTKLIQQIPTMAPDIIVVGLGGNDAFSLNSPWFWRGRIRLLIAQLRDKFDDAPIVFAAIPPIASFPAFTPLIRRVVGGLSEILGGVLAEEARRHSEVYFQTPAIDLKDWEQQGSGKLDAKDFFSDGVHPSPLTYHLWAKALVDFILTQDELRQRLLKQ